MYFAPRASLSRSGVAYSSAVALAALFSALWLYTFRLTLASRDSCVLYRGTEVIQQPVNLSLLTQRNVFEAVRFLRDDGGGSESADAKVYSEDEDGVGKRPFFLYFSFVKVHTALFNAPGFDGATRHGAYGDNVAETDWAVGRVRAPLYALLLPPFPPAPSLCAHHSLTVALTFPFACLCTRTRTYTAVCVCVAVVCIGIGVIGR